MMRYPQSKKSNLSVQVDAAINSGYRCCFFVMMTMMILFAHAVDQLCLRSGGHCLLCGSGGPAMSKGACVGVAF